MHRTALLNAGIALGVAPAGAKSLRGRVPKVLVTSTGTHNDDDRMVTPALSALQTRQSPALIRRRKTTRVAFQPVQQAGESIRTLLKDS